MSPEKKKNLKLIGVRLRPDQLSILRREAMKRAEQRGLMKSDASEIIREALDFWASAQKIRP